MTRGATPAPSTLPADSRVGDAIAVVLVAHVVLILSSMVVLGVGGWATGEVPLGAQLAATAPFWLAAVGGSVWAWRRWEPGVRPVAWLVGEGHGRWALVRSGVVGVVVGALTSLVGVRALYAPLHQWWGTTPGELEAPARALVERADASVAGVVLLVVMTCVGAPVAEEVMYRGVLLTALGRWGTWTAAVGSAVVFAAMHFQALQMPGLILIGLVLAVLRQRTGSLVGPVVAHVAFNATTVVVLLAQS